jgi:hypothetical protein
MSLEKKSLFHDPGWPSSGRFPKSRDFVWDSITVECGRLDCVANHNKKCAMPSRIKIGSNGKCLGEQS